VIQSYRIGHCESAWKCRLHCKPLFDLLWGTEKLLTSVDGVAIATPPKKGKNEVGIPKCFKHKTVTTIEASEAIASLKIPSIFF
jgi:hypothetical protein